MAIPSFAWGAKKDQEVPGDIPSADGTIHGCYREHENGKENQGRLRAVSDPGKCKKDEMPLSWSQGGGGGGGRRFVVVDAHDVEVGQAHPIVGSRSRQVTVFLTDNGQAYPVRVLRDRFLDLADRFLFETPNCTGRVYTLPPGDPGIVPMTRVGGDRDAPAGAGNTLYAADTGSPTESRFILEEVVNLAPNSRLCTSPIFPFTADVVPLNPVLDLDANFAPPLRVEAK